LLTPDDLSIEWRPLYDLVVLYIDKRSSKGDIIRFFPAVEQNVHRLVQMCVPYIPLAANVEIFNALIPQLPCLDNGRNDSTMEILVCFLNPYSYDVWFDYLMNMWNTYQNPNWNAEIMNLFASTAAHTIGKIDWKPHIPLMFVRILRSLELPVSYKQIKSSKNQYLSADACALWIVSVIGPSNDTLKYLRNLFSSIETYLNPANNGKV
jgi:proteasome activator subunit 4